LATAGGVPLAWLVLRSIFVDDDGTFLSELPALAALVWAIWLAILYVVYRRIKPDLFMLAGCCLSGITVIVSFLARHMLEDGYAGSFLVLSLLVVGMGAGAAFWLKNVHRECQP
jgi:hypothetical protein